MGSPIRGIDGVLKACSTVDGTYTEVAYVDSFEVSLDNDSFEITKINATSKEKVAGLGSGSASISGTLIWDDTHQNTMLNQFVIVDNKGSVSAVDKTALFFKGYLKQGDASGTGDEKTSVSIDCELVPTSISVSMSSGSQHTFSYSGETSGDVTYTIEDETT